MAPDPAILLDISRLISRLGQGPATGIDRVEAEWLAHLAQAGIPHLLLARVPRGQLLLPPQAGAALLSWLAGQGDLPRPGLWDRLRGRTGAIQRAHRALRRMALARTGASGRGMAARARRRLGPAIYLNVGHSNISSALWSNLAPLRRVALIHDLIPLDHPEYTRAGQSEKFRARIRTVLREADLILTISRATRADLLRWREAMGLPDRAPVIATPIGTRLAAPSDLDLGLDLKSPFFLTIGTIEPRKNHALLLDAWQELARRLPPDRVPGLIIAGRRGWENHQTFARLDALPKDGPVRELNDLADAALAQLLCRSHGLLMPSRAEGYGLPLTEAAGRGIPVLCAPLPAARELLGDYARYLPADDPGAWAAEIMTMAARPPWRGPAHPVQQWDSHFQLVAQAMR
ncbi:MAG: glycosyltransferase family 1 protein [Paracoccus sp. (in: a-proteobacteria)]|uniref:glycosyltransferase family 4 protein n=1 Tax=Paracoccus sp. TaxID=267 RepID=UPI0039E5D23F